MQDVSAAEPVVADVLAAFRQNLITIGNRTRLERSNRCVCLTRKPATLTIRRGVFFEMIVGRSVVVASFTTGEGGTQLVFS